MSWSYVFVGPTPSRPQLPLPTHTSQPFFASAALPCRLTKAGRRAGTHLLVGYSWVSRGLLGVAGRRSFVAVKTGGLVRVGWRARLDLRLAPYAKGNPSRATRWLYSGIRITTATGVSGAWFVLVTYSRSSHLSLPLFQPSYIYSYFPTATFQSSSSTPTSLLQLPTTYPSHSTTLCHPDRSRSCLCVWGRLLRSQSPPMVTDDGGTRRACVVVLGSSGAAA